MYPNVDQSLAALREAEAVAHALDRNYEAVNCNRLFDFLVNPRQYGRVQSLLRHVQVARQCR